MQALYGPVKDSDGPVIRIIMLATDFTADRMRTSEYEAKVAAINRVQGIVEFDLKGHVLWANETFLQLLT